MMRKEVAQNSSIAPRNSTNKGWPVPKTNKMSVLLLEHNYITYGLTLWVPQCTSLPQRIAMIISN